MKLTSLELLGFKSFLNRTTFRFGEGVTCVVGPNGCGKSNIVDAMTWVLGERGTKSLRVKEMGDVIFHGSGSKKQVNMAEVTIGLTNSEKEYAIKRRIYRDGVNEYYINNDLVRLKDIQDFLLGTGVGLHNYAIIEQGNIEYFTQMKPHERRIVVEETSGITRFEEKKRDAFVRMEEVRANLERVEDIQREVLKNYEKAREEAGRLKIHNGLREKLRDIDVSLLVDGFWRLEKREIKLREREELFLKEMEAREAARYAIRGKMGAKDDEIALVDAVSRKSELDIKDNEKDMENRLLEINYTEDERKRLEASAADLHKEITRLSEQISRHEREIAELRASTDKEKDALAKISSAGQELEARREELRRVRDRLEKEGEQGRNHLFAVMTRLTEIRNAILENERMVKEREARQQRKHEEEKGLREKLRSLEETLSVLQQRMAMEKGEKARLDAEERELAERIEGIGKELVQLRSNAERLKGLRKGKEDIFRQMKSYSEVQKKKAVPYGQLINILKPSKETEQVMEKFFSKEMGYHILSEDDPHSLATIAREYGENFIFFPQKGMFSLHNGEADVNLQMVPDLPEAFRRIADGQEGLFFAGNILVDSRGFIRRGQDKNPLSIQEFREKMKLETEIAEIDEQLNGMEGKLSGLQSSQKELERSRQIGRDRRRERESALGGIDREVIDITAQMRVVKERLLETTATLESPLDEATPSSDTESDAEKKEREEERVRIEQLLVDLKEKLTETKESYEAADAEYHQTSIAIERSRNQLRKNEDEAARTEAALAAFRSDMLLKEGKAGQTEEGLIRAAEKAVELDNSYESLRESFKASVARYEEMKAKLGDLHMEKVAIQVELQSLDQEMEKARSKNEGLEKEKLVIIEKKDTILERLRSDYGVERIEDAPVQPVGNDSERQEILSDLSTLGEVNFRAEKERVELKERLDFLEKQKADLVQAVDSLKKTIGKIDSVSRELFLETFERVNEAFKRFTHTLFKGGHGALTLNQDTNGIELYVQPPGKKVIRMELLSGGEKALISLAFLLSLMDTKASPFTLMDEIDAPLDDANLLSLLEIVKMISNRTQMILITHNRMTMESAGTIYGVTMEQDGVSKTISIRL
jgi:chromosome segregation protein